MKTEQNNELQTYVRKLRKKHKGKMLKIGLPKSIPWKGIRIMRNPDLTLLLKDGRLIGITIEITPLN